MVPPALTLVRPARVTGLRWDATGTWHRIRPRRTTYIDPPNVASEAAGGFEELAPFGKVDSTVLRVSVGHPTRL